ncbi:MAG: hypothetical protein ACPLRN_04215, partial [Microgenomates group bacterium]
MSIEDKILIKYLIDNILKEINFTNIKSWTVGITNDPYRRKSEHGNPKFFYYFDCYNEEIVRWIERYF